MPIAPRLGPLARRKRLLAFVALATALAALTYAVGLGGLDADAILSRRAWLAAAAAEHPVIVLAAYCAVYVAGMSLALPLGGVLAILAGFLFGRWPGLGLVVLTGTASALVVYWTARRIAGERLDLPEAPFGRLAEGMRRHGFLAVLAMRIIPAFPFFVVTLVAALAGIRLRAFVAATVLGKVPASLIYTTVGATLGQAESFGEVVTTESVVGLTCLGVLALVPIAYRVIRARQVARSRPTGGASASGARLTEPA